MERENLELAISGIREFLGDISQLSRYIKGLRLVGMVLVAVVICRIHLGQSCPKYGLWSGNLSYHRTGLEIDCL